MRLLYLSHGLTGHDLRFLARFRAWGLEVLHVTLEPLPDDLPTLQHVRRLSLASGADQNDASRLQALNFAIQEWSPDVIHAGPVPTAAFLAAQTGFSRLFVMSWGYDLLYDVLHDPSMAEQARVALRAAECVVCDCIAAQQAAVRLAGLSASRFVRFPWGLTRDRFALAGQDEGLRRSLGWQHQIVAVSTRAWEPIYNPLLVLQAFAQAYRQDQRLRLLMAGSGSLAPAVLARIKAEGLTAVVHCAGRLPEDRLMAVYAAGDMYLSAAAVDGTSVSLLEAMASALPVVVPRIDGNREWVDAAGNGLYFQPGNAVELAAQLLALSAMPIEGRRRMGQRGLMYVTQAAVWEDNSEKLLLAYQAVPPI